MGYLSRGSFWAGVAERSIKTGAQAMLAGITAGSAIWDQPWQASGGIALTAMAISVLTAIADPQRTDTAVATGA